MSGTKRWWIPLLAVLVLALPGCTNNKIDESDADVILKALTIDQPPVQAVDVEGRCSLDTTIECTENTVCSDQLAGFCEFDPTSGCEVQEWTFSFEADPLNAGAIDSGLNDVLVQSILVTFDPGSGPVTGVVTVGQTIPVGSIGEVVFKPIATQAIDVAYDAADLPIDVPLSFSWSAQTVSGNTVTVVGASGGVLTIEACLVP